MGPLTNARSSMARGAAAALLGAGLLLLAARALADAADPLFDDTRVQTCELTFPQASWWDSLRAYAEEGENRYLPAHLAYGGQVLDSVGVRLRGKFPDDHPEALKQPLKIKFDAFRPGQRLRGLRALSFENGYKDPTLLRAKLFYDLLRGQGLPAPRANPVRLALNGQAWGLYLQVEEIDKSFIQSRFGATEDGNLFEGGPDGTLAWLGPEVEPYREAYSLETNETADDWSDLIALIELIDRVPESAPPADLAGFFDVEGFLRAQATGAVCVNLDSYWGKAENYLLYHRQQTDRFHFLPWDCGEAFGASDLAHSVDELHRLDPFWLPPAQSGPRPLLEHLWRVDAWRRLYLREIARLLRAELQPDSFTARVEAWAERIRPELEADPHRLYPMALFDQNLHAAALVEGERIPGLTSLIRARRDHLLPLLNGYADPGDLRLNELQGINRHTVRDESGDYDPWIELYNLGPGRTSTAGLYLSNDAEEPLCWPLPEAIVEAGGVLVFWVDGEPDEGATHARFPLEMIGGRLYLSRAPEGAAETIDVVEYDPVRADGAWARLPDGDGDWRRTLTPTPGRPNAAESVAIEGVYLNEIMAANDTVLPDEYGEYDDWIEIVNLGRAPVDLGGWGLSDTPTAPLHWTLPDTTLAPGAYLLVWADGDVWQGELHAGFALGAAGEELTLSLPDRTEVDRVRFGAQQDDVSYGRLPDGTGAWIYLQVPTPGARNRATAALHPRAADRSRPAVRVTLSPLPFTGDRLRIQLAPAGPLGAGSARVVDLQGRCVRRLEAFSAPEGFELLWDGRDERGEAAPAGVYFVRFGDGEILPPLRLLRVQ